MGADVGHAGFSGRDHGRVHGDATEEVHARLQGHRLGAAAQEDVRRLTAVRADEPAHVLDDSEHGQMHRVAEAQRLAHVVHGDPLWRGDDDGAGAGSKELDEGERLVPGTRRRVHDQAVQMTPVDPGEHLADRGVLAWATPDHRVVVLRQEELDGHRPQVLADRGRGDAAGPPGPGLVVQSKEARYAVGRAGRRRGARRGVRRRPAPSPGSRRRCSCRRRPCRRAPGTCGAPAACGRRAGPAAHARRTSDPAAPVAGVTAGFFATLPVRHG